MSNIKFSSLDYRALQAICKSAKAEKLIFVRLNSKREVLIEAIKDAVEQGFVDSRLPVSQPKTFVASKELVAYQKMVKNNQHGITEKQYAVESGNAIASCELVLKHVECSNASMHTLPEYKSIDELAVIDAAIEADKSGDTAIAVDFLAYVVIVDVCMHAIRKAHTRVDRTVVRYNNIVEFPKLRHKGIRKAAKRLAEIKKLYNDRDRLIDGLFAPAIASMR